MIVIQHTSPTNKANNAFSHPKKMNQRTLMAILVVLLDDETVFPKGKKMTLPT